MSINTSSASKVVPFQFKSNLQIRTVKKDGEPWFVAGDICKALGLGNVTKAILRIPQKHKGLNSIQTLGGIQRTNLISESGMYRLVLRSDKPEAEPFIEWVTSEVLPTIRKTGRYMQPDFEWEFSRKRFIVSFRNDNKAFLKEIPDDQFLISREDIPRWIADPGNYFSQDEGHELLKRIALASIARLSMYPSEAYDLFFAKGKGVR